MSRVSMASFKPDEERVNESLWGDKRGYEAVKDRHAKEMQEYLNGTARTTGTTGRVLR
jgi:hypothetical protein